MQFLVFTETGAVACVSARKVSTAKRKFDCWIDGGTAMQHNARTKVLRPIGSGTGPKSQRVESAPNSSALPVLGISKLVSPVTTVRFLPKHT